MPAGGSRRRQASGRTARSLATTTTHEHDAAGLTVGGAGHARGHKGQHPHELDSSPGAAWDRRYTEMDWSSEPDETLVERVSRLAPGRALDLGCGPGRNAIWLARQGWNVTGVDVSAVGLAQAEERAGAAGVTLELVRADVLAFTPPGGWADLIVVANLHFAPGEREGFFARSITSLAPGGHLYVSGHHRESLGRAGPPDPDRLYTEQLLAELLAPLTVEVRRHVRSSGAGRPPRVDTVAWASAPSGEQAP